MPQQCEAGFNFCLSSCVLAPSIGKAGTPVFPYQHPDLVGTYTPFPRSLPATCVSLSPSQQSRPPPAWPRCPLVAAARERLAAVGRPLLDPGACVRLLLNAELSRPAASPSSCYPWAFQEWGGAACERCVESNQLCVNCSSHRAWAIGGHSVHPKPGTDAERFPWARRLSCIVFYWTELKLKPFVAPYSKVSTRTDFKHVSRRWLLFTAFALSQKPLLLEHRNTTAVECSQHRLCRRNGNYPNPGSISTEGEAGERQLGNDLGVSWEWSLYTAPPAATYDDS